MYGFDYYYGAESEQFAFYRIPRALMKESRFKKLSAEAKILYGLMLDRMSLSAQNGWIDDDNRVFIYYTFENIMDDLGCAREKCTKILSELDSNKGIGLIEKKRQGQGKPSRIYVMNFATISQKFENRTSRVSENELQEVRKTNPNYNKKNKTNGVIISDLPEDNSRSEDTDMMELIREQIDYDSYMVSLDGMRKELFQELYQLICDVVCIPRKEVVISGQAYPYEVVKSRFLSLRGRHIEYVLETMEHNISNIRNIRAYLLTTLYHSTETVEHYWQQRVAYDMAHTDWDGLQENKGYNSG